MVVGGGAGADGERGGADRERAETLGGRGKVVGVAVGERAGADRERVEAVGEREAEVGERVGVSL